MNWLMYLHPSETNQIALTGLNISSLVNPYQNANTDECSRNNNNIIFLKCGVEQRAWVALSMILVMKIITGNIIECMDDA